MKILEEQFQIQEIGILRNIISQLGLTFMEYLRVNNLLYSRVINLVLLKPDSYHICPFVSKRTLVVLLGIHWLKIILAVIIG